MQKEYLFSGAILIVVLIMGVFISGCTNQLTEVEEVAIGSSSSDKTATMEITVSDNSNGEPIENVIVYLGAKGGSGKCYTDKNGKCSIHDVYFGSYGVNVFKKGYYRPEVKRGESKREDEFIYVKLGLEKKPEIPATITVSGNIIEVITAKGTRSENRFFKIKDNQGNEEYIFDEIGVNQDFEKYVNRKVTITGFKEIGFIGWEYQQVEGIYIESIK